VTPAILARQLPLDPAIGAILQGSSGQMQSPHGGQAQDHGVVALLRRIGHREYPKVGIRHRDRCAGQPLDQPLEQLLFADRLTAVHRTPHRARSHPRIKIVRRQQAQQGPVRYAVLIAGGRISSFQLCAMRHAHRSAVKEKGGSPLGRHLGLRHELLEGVITTLFHHRQRQLMPGLVVRSRLLGQ